MMPPVEVPESMSNRSLIARPVRSSMASRINAGMMPRIPPPSMASTLNGVAMNAQDKVPDRRGGPGFGMPLADTGNPVLDWISNTLLSLVQAERRIDPFFRPWFDALFCERLTEWLTDLINARRTDAGLRLAEGPEQPRWSSAPAGHPCGVR